MEPQRIFVRGPNWVGDVVMATPVLRSLRERFPRADIHLGLRPYARPIMEASPFVDELHSLNGRGLGGSWRISRALKTQGFDLAVLLTNSLGSALEVFLAGIKRRVGYVGDGRSWLLTDRIQPLMSGRQRLPVPMVDFYQRIIEGLGCSLVNRQYSLSVGESDEAWAQSWFESQGIHEGEVVVGLNPGAKFGSSKLWAADRFAEVGDHLHRELGAKVVLLGGPGEEPLLNDIEVAMKEPCLNTAGGLIPLGPLMGVVKRLQLLVTTDTGPRAIAQAFAVPSVVVMGPTHPDWTACNNEKSVILRHDVPCGPCHKKVCDLDHACMTQIEAQQAVQAAFELLKR